MFLKLIRICAILLTVLVIQVISQSSLLNLFESGASEHVGTNGGANIHTLFKFGSPSYRGITTSEQSEGSTMNGINPFNFQQPQQQIYRYPQNNYYYPQQYYGKK